MGPVWSTCASDKKQVDEEKDDSPPPVSYTADTGADEKAADVPQESPKLDRKASTSEVVPEIEEVNTTKMPELPQAHTKARCSDYPSAPEDVKRSDVSDEHVRWTVEWTEYKPVTYTNKKIIEEKPVWADPDVEDKDGFSKIKFNQMDGAVNRTSYHGKYDMEKLADMDVPRNPSGRTGMKGRGLLGKWGPNHAADPIVTRFKRDENGEVIEKDGKKVIEFVAIQRRDCQEWAIPGGMVDNGEHVSATLKREFGEEALNTIEEDEKEETKKLMAEFFKNGEKIYEGYVDDPRNTDNAWMETCAYNFHDADGKTAGRIPLNAGDDAKAVKWMAIDGSIQVYASHKDFLQRVCEKLGVHF